MNLKSLLSGFAAALLGKLESLGASLAVSFGTLVMGYTQQERQIISDAKQLWHDTYTAAKTANKSEIDAIEEATTAAYNKFAHDEKDEFHQIVGGIISFVEGAFKRAAGIVVDSATGG